MSEDSEAILCIRRASRKRRTQKARMPRLPTCHHFVEGYCRDPSTPQRQKAPLLRSG